MPAAAKDRLPWPYTAAALVAVFLLHASGKTNDFRLPLIAGFIGAAWVTSMRIPDSRLLTWTLRVVIWTVLLLVSPPRHAIGASIMFEPDYVHLFGCFCAAELALRVWTRTASGPSRGETLLLTALIITAASNTDHREHMHLLTPVYALLVILCLRTFSKQPAPQGAPGRKLRLGRLVALRGASGLAALAIGFTVVFAVTRYEYRITSWFVQFTRAPRQSEIGLSDAPRLGEVFNPKASMSRVLLIDGPRSERHLRALVYDTYVDQRWRSYTDSTYREVEPQALEVAAPPGAFELRFTRLSAHLQIVPLPLETAALYMEQQLKRNVHGSIRTQNADSGDRYRAIVARSDTFQGPMSVAPENEDLPRLLRIPDQVDPKVTALARRIAGNDPNPHVRVGKLALYLRATHRYSLRYQPQGEPLSDFILNNRDAHCQYFASAMVVMTRAAGVPSRFVGGYYAHEAYDDEQMVVRDRDAHAWAECWIEGTGWVTVDATPAAGLPDQVYSPPSKWRRLWERISDVPARVRNFFSSISSGTWTLLILSIAATALAIAGIRQLYLRRRNRAASVKHRAYATASPGLVEAAKRFDRWLIRRQMPCPPNTTWREHVSPCPRERGEGGGEGLDEHKRTLVLAFISTYEEARFGNVNGDTHARLNQLLHTLEQTP